MLLVLFCLSDLMCPKDCEVGCLSHGVMCPKEHVISVFNLLSACFSVPVDQCYSEFDARGCSPLADSIVLLGGIKSFSSSSGLLHNTSRGSIKGE